MKSSHPSESTGVNSPEYPQSYAALDSVGGALDLLDRRLIALWDRLQPVLDRHPNLGAAEPRDPKDVPLCSPLVERIRDLDAKAANLCRFVETFHEKLGL